MVSRSINLTGILKNVFVVSILLVLAIILINIYLVLQQSENHPISEKSATIHSQFSYFIDEESTFNIDDLTDLNMMFIDSRASNIPFELGTKTYWVKINVENMSSDIQQLVLHADNTMLAELDIYQISEEQTSAHLYSLAQNVKNPNGQAQELKILDKAFPHVAFSVASHDQITLLARLNTQGPPNVPFIIYSQENFEYRLQLSEAIFSAFIGIILLMSAYNFVLYFAVRDKVYLVYIGYLLAAFTVLASVNGYGYLIFSEQLQLWLNNYSLVFHALLVIFLLLFALYFLRYDQAKDLSYKVGILLCLVMLVVSLASLFVDQVTQAKAFFSLQPVFYLYALIIVGRRLREDFSWARFYFISWLPLLAGAAIQPLMLLNYIEYSFWAQHAFLLGVLVEITFMAFALAERMRRNEQDRLTDIGYHQTTKLPRKLMLEEAINNLLYKQTRKFSVLVIKPEQLDRIALYVDEATTINLFKRLNRFLTPLFAYNDAIVDITNRREKICFLENSSLALLIDHKKNNQPMQVIVNSIQQIIIEKYQIDQLQLPLSGIIGIANYPEHGDSAHLLINRAQLALKDAENSHQKWSYFTAELSDKTNYLLKLAADMKEALANNAFEIYHQPQIDLKTLRVCGSECLIRWRHKIEGDIPPEVFIPIAEDMGLINQMTVWVVNQALSQHKEIIENGYTNHMVSINISGKDIASEHFYHQIKDALKLADIAPEKVIFELTESATITTSEQALSTIEQLSDLGITVSIDDFGTGYSSMAYISQLPFQELKIDRQFVENVCDSIKRRTICETTVKMAKGLKLEVVAEGINSELDERTLRQFGCDIGQGFYYAEPMPLANYLTWLDKQVNGQTPGSTDGEFIPAAQAKNANQEREIK